MLLRKMGQREKNGGLVLTKQSDKWLIEDKINKVSCIDPEPVIMKWCRVKDQVYGQTGWSYTYKWLQKQNTFEIVESSGKDVIIKSNDFYHSLPNRQVMLNYGTTVIYLTYRGKDFHLIIPHAQPFQVLIALGGGQFMTENLERELLLYDVFEDEKRALFKIPQLNRDLRKHVMSYLC
jgi:hypothetical protein